MCYKLIFAVHVCRKGRVNAVNRCGHSPANLTPFFNGNLSAPSLFGSRLGLLHSEKRERGGKYIVAVSVALIDVMIFATYA